MPDATTVLFLLRRVDCNDGVSSYCETLMTGMKARGDRVVVISGRVTAPPKTQARRRALAAAAAEWIILDDFRAGRPQLKTIRLMLAAMARHSVDVISPQGLSMLPLSWILSRLSGKPVVTNYHPSIHGNDVRSLDRRHGVKKRLSYRLTATFFRPWKFIALSKDIIRFFRDECGISPRRIEYIVAGIDSARYRKPSEAERKAARHAFQLADAALVCVLTGRLNFNKGHDLVIDAVRQLRRSDPDLPIICLFPGSGDDAAAIKADAGTDPADLAAFRFLGFVDDKTLLQAYWAADIALLPSRHEGFGLAIAEAMACGAVPIRTPSGGAEDQIIEGKTGFVIPFNDSGALAARIRMLAEPGRRQTMRDAAIAHAETYFGKEMMVSRTSDLYRQARSNR